MQAPQPVVTPAVAAGAPPPVVVQYQAPVRAPRIYDNLACKQMKVLGIMQIICGIVAFIFNAVAIGINAGAAFVGHGFWCGVFVSLDFYTYIYLLVSESDTDIAVMFSCV